MHSSAPLVASIGLGAAVAWYRFLGLDGSEFSGGWLTGPLLKLQFGGTLLITFALFAAFAYPRAAAAMTLAAVACCLPLHLYFLVPGFFRAFAPGEYSIPMRSYFEFNSLDFLSVIVLVGVAALSFSTVKNARQVKLLR
jgi:hypothetical protein